MERIQFALAGLPYLVRGTYTRPLFELTSQLPWDPNSSPEHEAEERKAQMRQDFAAKDRMLITSEPRRDGETRRVNVNLSSLWTRSTDECLVSTFDPADDDTDSDLHLGSKLNKCRTPDGEDDIDCPLGCCWSTSGDDYVRSVIDDIETKLATQGRRLNANQRSPMSTGCRPELDASPELDDERALLTFRR